MSYSREKTNGSSVLTPHGKFIGLASTGERKVFDTGDIVRNSGEASGLFVATKI
jgi:hypothetical protein